MIDVMRIPDLPGLLQTGADGVQWFLAGILTAIVLYHLLVSVQTRHAPTLWLSLYTAALAGLLFTPLSSQIAAVPAEWQRVGAALLVILTGTILTSSALRLRQRYPWSRRVLLVGWCLLVLICAWVAGVPDVLPYPLSYGRELVAGGLWTAIAAIAAVAVMVAWRGRRRGHLLYAGAWLLALAALPMVWLQAPQQVGYSAPAWLLLVHLLLLAVAMAERVNVLEQKLHRSEVIEGGQRELFGRVEHLTTTHIHAALGAAELLRIAPRRDYLGIVERSVQGLLRDMSVAEANAALARGDDFRAAVDMPLRQLVEHVLANLSPLASARRLALYGLIDPALPAIAHADVRHLQCLLSVALEHGLRNCTGAEVVLRVEGDLDRPGNARFVMAAAQAAVTAGGWRDEEVQAWLGRMAAALGGSSGLSAKGSRLEQSLAVPLFASDDSQMETADARSERRAGLEPGRILIVDPLDTFRHTAAGVLRGLGNTVDAVASVEQAIELHTSPEDGEAAADGFGPNPRHSGDWLWDSDEGAAAEEGGIAPAADRVGAAAAPGRSVVRYERLLLAASAQEQDDSQLQLEQLLRAGIVAHHSLILLPPWQLIRAGATPQPSQSRRTQQHTRPDVGRSAPAQERGTGEAALRERMAEALAGRNAGNPVPGGGVVDVANTEEPGSGLPGRAPLAVFADGSPGTDADPTAGLQINRIHRPLLVEELVRELTQMDMRSPAPITSLRAVLALEDEDLAAVVVGILQNIGCKVSIANSGRLLMHRYTRGRHGLSTPYDLVLLEDSEDGLSTARQIREFEAGRGPQRVCMVVLTRPAERSCDWYRDGFDAAVPLPLTVSRLRSAVQRAAVARSGAGPETRRQELAGHIGS